MKQLITALVLSLSITSLTANPVVTVKPTKHLLSNFDDRKDELTITPNLKAGTASISFKADKACKGMVIVFDEAGKVVFKQQVKMNAGKNKISLNNFTNLEQGNYTVCLNTCHKIYSTPFLFWK